jgi:UDP-glucose 4-epimerase
MSTLILITGAAGMIGSHLADRILAETEDHIIGLDDFSVGSAENIAHLANEPRFDFVEGNILDEKCLARLPRCGLIFHLAAAKKIGEANPGVENLRINGIGSENVFKLALDHGAKVVFGSTSDCYGMSPDLPLRENGDSLIGPTMIKRWSYAVGKLYAEQLAFAYHKDHHLPIVILRYFGGFSERASFTWSSGHVPLFIDAVLRDEECVIHGDGAQTRSMTHVDNLVEGTWLAARHDAAVGEMINIGDDEEISVLECARIVHRLADTGRPLKTRFIPMSELFGQYKDIQRRKPDLGKAVNLLGYQPKLTFAEGLQRVIAERRRISSTTKVKK